jgi:predicted AlkP superfamily phosphohydrolase/phosphomutase
MNQGVTRVLKSTVPPISPPAWTTFLTGKNPGQHGIFQFVDMDVRSYGFTSNRLINSSLFSGQTFIDFLSNGNRKVGIVKVPFTYPPWKVNGFMVAGEPSPDWRKAHTYPPALSKKLGRVNLGSGLDFIRYNTEDLLRHLKFDCDVRTRITCEMMGNDTYDFFMVVHNITDAAAHRFWKFTDQTCPNYEDSFSKYNHIIRDIYVEADKSIGQILSKLDSTTTLFFMSDHGVSRKPIHFFHINAWMKENGYLHCKNKKSSAKVINSILIQAKNSLPPTLRHLIIRTIKTHFLNKLSTFQTKVANFEWNKTRAYALDIYPRYCGIALNLKGRQPNGIVNAGIEAERLCSEIQSTLLELKDPRNGKRVIDRVFRREEVFRGDFSQKMPELIIQYSNNYRSGKNTTTPLFTDVPASDFDFQSGDHDEDGIFIAWGPYVRKGLELPPAQIQDLAPTVLHAMGLPVPDDMDGEVLLDVFEKDFVAKTPVKKVRGRKWTASKTYRISKEEEEEMKDQLKGLGYM